MENRVNVMVSGASGVVGYGILKSLESSAYNRISSTIKQYSAANKFSEVFELAPNTLSIEYKAWLENCLRRNKVSIAFPGIDADMYWWSENRELFKINNTQVVLNNAELINLCRDKWLFYQKLKETECSIFLIPTLIEGNYNQLRKELGSRLFIKPRQGFGSKGVSLIETEQDFIYCGGNEHEKNIIQPYIGDEKQEFTVAAFGDGMGGFFNIFSMRRVLSKEGFTQECEVVNSDIFKKAVSKFCKVLKPVGPTNFQFRLADNTPKLLEINPRISSSSSIRAKFGYNESEMAVDFYLRDIVPKPCGINSGKAIRYSEDVTFAL